MGLNLICAICPFKSIDEEDNLYYLPIQIKNISQRRREGVIIAEQELNNFNSTLSVDSVPLRENLF